MVEVTSVVGNFRDELGKTFAAVGEAFPELYVVTADVSKSTRSRMFGERWPDRFYSVGIAEADAVGIAAGIASFGGPVIFTAYGVFATEKPFEQIRNCLCYPNLNVKIVATHGGISVGEDGATHQAVEDIAIMRALPNMKVLVAADPGEVRGAVFAALQTPGPVYVRLGGWGPPSTWSRKQSISGWGRARSCGTARTSRSLRWASWWSGPCAPRSCWRRRASRRR